MDYTIILDKFADEISQYVQNYSLLNKKVALEMIKRDVNRLSYISKLLKTTTTKDVFKTCFSMSSSESIKEVSDLLCFDHIAILISTPLEIIDFYLRSEGYDNFKLFPSEVVRERFTNRYKIKLPAGSDIPVEIFKADINIQNLDKECKNTVRRIEIFCPHPVAGILFKEDIDQEVKNDYEFHYAFSPISISKNLTERVRRELVTNRYFSDGGGYNKNENVSVFYYLNKGGKKKTRIEFIFQSEIEVFIDV